MWFSVVWGFLVLKTLYYKFWCLPKDIDTPKRDIECLYQVGFFFANLEMSLSSWNYRQCSVQLVEGQGYRPKFISNNHKIKWNLLVSIPVNPNFIGLYSNQSPTFISIIMKSNVEIFHFQYWWTGEPSNISVLTPKY
jgi:hypothetical protein